MPEDSLAEAASSCSWPDALSISAWDTSNSMSASPAAPGAAAPRGAAGMLSGGRLRAAEAAVAPALSCRSSRVRMDARLAQTRLTLRPVSSHRCRRNDSSVGVHDATKKRSSATPSGTTSLSRASRTRKAWNASGSTEKRTVSTSGIPATRAKARSRSSVVSNMRRTNSADWLRR